MTKSQPSAGYLGWILAALFAGALFGRSTAEAKRNDSSQAKYSYSEKATDLTTLGFAANTASDQGWEVQSAIVDKDDNVFLLLRKPRP